MKPNPPRPPGDDEIDALLARQYRDTTPEFEARWVGLKRELRTTPRRGSWRPVWFGLFALGAAAAILLTVSTRWQPTAPAGQAGAISPALAELLSMDEVLGRGRALLDAENREALLHLTPALPPRS